MQISNYRGVTLGSHFGKLFCQILKRRLTTIVDREGIWGKHRAGLLEDEADGRSAV